MNEYMDWLSRLLALRMDQFLQQQEGIDEQIEDCLRQMPALVDHPNLSLVFNEKDAAVDDIILLTLAIAPSFKPELLDVLKLVNSNWGQRFSEFGGWLDAQYMPVLPTMDTALFLLAGTATAARQYWLSKTDAGHFMFQHGWVKAEPRQAGIPFTGFVLTATAELNSLLLTGREYSPEFSASFPAKKLHTSAEWSDLVLEDDVMEQVTEIKSWIVHQDALMNDWKMAGKLKPGYRSLFYGPSGTGKTFTAALIGKYCGLEVYRVDLSQVVSKYIGETEQNLAGIFARAEHKDWILFFDEADSLFGKRTQVSSSNDRFANQEVSYLLQRVEDFPGMVILATNLKANIDEAFARRFQSVIQFTMPRAPQRLMLWRNCFPDAVSLEDRISLADIADRYELSGGSIINVVQYACLKALHRASTRIELGDIVNGIRREMQKSGRSL